MFTKGALLAVCVALMGVVNAFVVPGPSKIISGRPTRSSTSQVIVMGRGDTRTPKGKRMRHTYGKCRPQKKKDVVYFEGEVVKKAAPVARRWENIEYDEAAMALAKPAAVASAAAEEVMEAGVDSAVDAVGSAFEEAEAEAEEVAEEVADIAADAEEVVEKAVAEA